MRKWRAEIKIVPLSPLGNEGSGPPSLHLLGWASSNLWKCENCRVSYMLAFKTTSALQLNTSMSQSHFLCFSSNFIL